MMPPVRIADRLEAVVDLIGRTAAWATLALVLLVAVNVLLRYLLRMGSVSLQELEWHLLAPIALFGMSYTMRHGGHVRVDFVYDRLPAVLRKTLDLVAAIVTVVVAILIIKYSIGYVGQSWRIGEGSPDPGGLPARYVLKALIPLGFLVLGLQGVALVIRNAASLAGLPAERSEGRRPVAVRARPAAGG